MMIELGKYAADVLSAYAVSVLLLAAIVVLTLRRGAMVKKRLRAAEERAAKHG